MSLVPSTLIWIALGLAPSVLWLRFVWTRPERPDPARWVVITLVFGAVAAAAVVGLQLLAARLLGPVATSLWVVLLLWGPTHEALKLAAAWPAYGSPQFDEAFDGALYAASSACGFAVVETAALAFGHPGGWSLAGATLVTAAVQAWTAGLWGHALGRSQQRGAASMRLVGAWALAALVHGVFDTGVLSASAMGWSLAVALLAALAAHQLWALRDLLPQGRPLSRLSARSVLPPITSPSFPALRQALRRSQRPLMLHWIVLGAFSTTGVILTALAAAVWAGHRLGVNFAAIEQPEAQRSAMAPLGLLTAAVMLAFPFSGWLITKASAADGVLEPALAAALAIVAVLVMMGLAAPEGLVFAIVLAPVAFVLACVGAWFGR